MKPKETIGPTPAARAGKLALLTLPFLVGLFCVFLTFVPIGSIVGIEVAPAFALMAVYYWAAHQPETFPPYAVFAVGLLQDLLSAGPIGLWAAFMLRGSVSRHAKILVTRNPPWPSARARRSQRSTVGSFCTSVAVEGLSMTKCTRVPPSSQMRVKA